VTDSASNDGEQMLANRLKKNQKHLSRWLRREGIDCYRLYDADIPEYAVAVDIYRGDQLWVHLQEYQAPKSIDPAIASQRLQLAQRVVCEQLNISPEQLFTKVRQQQKGNNQYQRLGRNRRFFPVAEGGHRFLVNFEDHLDTGLFLDHRITRGMLQQLAQDRTFLNLFAYTGTATVYAAAGGASSTTTIDLSNTYLDWARNNLNLNGIGGRQHRLVQADCIGWIAKAVSKEKRFGLIFLDPPSFSTSKRMQATFDVQRDHVELLQNTAALLEPDGTLIFSNNRRGFKMDRQALTELEIEEISAATLPNDFKRNPKIHNCWRIRQAA